MSYATELSPKLDEIRRRAKENYALHLNSLGLQFGPAGTIEYGQSSEVAMSEPVDVEEERRKWIRVNNDVEDLCTRFEAYDRLDPLDLTIITGYLGGPPQREPSTVVVSGSSSVPNWLNNAMDPWIDRVDGLIKEGSWQGQGATAFHTNFLWHFRDALEQQIGYTGVLAGVAQCYHTTITSGLNDMLTIADVCAARLGGDGPGPNESVSYTVGGIALGFLSFLPVVGPGMTAAGIAVGFASLWADPPAPLPTANDVPIDIAGGSVPAAVESTHAAIGIVADYFADADDALSDKLTTYLESPYCFDSPGLDVDRPDVAEPGDDSFAALKPDSNYVVETVDLYRAGFVNLPAAADRYQQARTTLHRCLLPRQLSMAFPRSQNQFDAAVSLFDLILGRTQDILIDTGANLVSAATHYELCDEDSAEALRQRTEILPPPEPVVTGTNNRSGVPVYAR